MYVDCKYSKYACMYTPRMILNKIVSAHNTLLVCTIPMPTPDSNGIHFIIISAVPSVPLQPVPMVVATSFEVAVINWIVFAVAYTPETFHIEYTKEGSMDREISAAVVMDTFDFSATDVVQSFILE